MHLNNDKNITFKHTFSLLSFSLNFKFYEEIYLFPPPRQCLTQCKNYYRVDLIGWWDDSAGNWPVWYVSFIPRRHMAERENRLLQASLWHVYTHTNIHAHT